MPSRKQLVPKIIETFKFAEIQLSNLIESHPDQFPMYTKNGIWNFTGESWTNWCEGFLGGQLWLVYEHNRDPWWRNKAEHYSRLIENRKSDRNVHDLGFLFWSTYKKWFDMTGEPVLDDVLIEAGNTMSMRYKEKGQYLRSFLSEDSLFIDIMMNVGIIFYAAQKLCDPNLFQKAYQHCLTTRRFLVRGDGSTAHEGIFDLETGQFLHQSTQQGWRNDSTWARGLAWALYGFGTVYEFTGDPRFIQTSQSCANYYIQNSPDHGIPPNDWEEPNPTYPYESSAAAIAAGGLWNLSKLVQDPVAAHTYHQYALQILETLMSSEFLAIETPGWQGILKHGMYHQNKGLGVDESVMWGDYFFLESISKVMRDE
jgi:unsaturated chondroitin disaccharide hydrolase